MWLRRMAARGAVVMDGALGTELERRGVGTPAPLWSAAALLTQPQLVEAIHAEYVEAGAEIVVANTFRTNPRALAAAGLFDRGRELNARAVGLARAAAVGTDGRGVRPEGRGSDSINRDRGAEGGRILVAASVAPVEDCYEPERVPDDATLRTEHATIMDWLSAAQAPPDLIWIETMNTVREARAAAGAARQAGFEFAVSFMTRESGELLSGERLADAVDALAPLQPLALGLNCIPPRRMGATLPRLLDEIERVFGAGQRSGRPLVAAYAHINNAKPTPGWRHSEAATPEQYGQHALGWIETGATIVGGCCGTTPAHIAAVRAAVAAGP